MLNRNSSDNLVSLEFLLLEVTSELFALGIFSVEGGAKAWFELFLMIATLSASGYFLWWQLPLIFLALFFGTIAAGMFSVLAPQYSTTSELQANPLVTSTLRTFNRYNTNYIRSLPKERLNQYLRKIKPEKLSEVQKILDNAFDQINTFDEIQFILGQISQNQNIAESALDEIYREEEEKRRKVQEELKQEKEKQEIYEQWLNSQRTSRGFSRGCPPDLRFYPYRCPPGYPIKVTMNKPDDGSSGIIWHPRDGKRYDLVTTPVWCFQTIKEAEAEPNHRFRRPGNTGNK